VGYKGAKEQIMFQSPQEEKEKREKDDDGDDAPVAFFISGCISTAPHLAI
jgi:hypothetical protein